MNDTIDEELSALLDGELAPARADALRARIAEEPELAARLARLERVDTALRGLRVPQASEALRARTRERIAGSAAASGAKSRRRIAPLLGAAAAAAAAVLLFWLVESPESEPTAPGEIADATDEEVGIALEYETLADLEIIEDLELLELWVDLEAGERGGLQEAGSGESGEHG